MADSQFTTSINQTRDTSLEISPVKTTLRGVISSLRPHQWIKNLLVFGGLIFSHSLLQASAVWLSVKAFVLFCIVSSAIYILNDLGDIEADRLHPLKCLRPLAAGTISRGVAGILMCALLMMCKPRADVCMAGKFAE